MNTATSLRSLKSLRSTKSEKSTRTTSEEGEIDFEEYIVTSCKRFLCPIDIKVIRNSHYHYHEKEPTGKPQKSRETTTTLRSRRVNVAPVPVPEVESSSEEIFTTKEQLELLEQIDLNSLGIIVSYDSLNRVTEISIPNFRTQPLPRMLIQLIGYVIPHYPQLNKFTIRNCRIDFYTLYELGKRLPHSTITDVSLDECPVPEGNYDLLLGNQSCIKHISLARCKINDAVCERLSSRLIYTEPAEVHLVALNLSSNDITDVGAKFIADALRSNRHLRYLNLADNNIGDEGASQLFDVLVEFPMTYDEIMDKRHRYMLYLQKKRTLVLEYLLKLGAKESIEQVNKKPNSNSVSKKASPVKSRASIKKERRKSQVSSDENLLLNANLPLKAEMMTRELLGPFIDPFSQENVRVDDGYAYCLGNLALCYLNLAYNNLTYMSVKKLLSVLEYQLPFNKLPMNGLMNVIIEGNYIPTMCAELHLINNILHKHIALCSKQISEKFTSRKSWIDKKNVLKLE